VKELIMTVTLRALKVFWVRVKRKVETKYFCHMGLEENTERTRKKTFKEKNV
jgi:hypothetical protein